MMDTKDNSIAEAPQENAVASPTEEAHAEENLVERPQEKTTTITVPPDSSPRAPPAATRAAKTSPEDNTEDEIPTADALFFRPTNDQMDGKKK